MDSRREPLEHTADTGFRVIAPSVEELFEECASAMFEVMYPRPTDPSTVARTVHATGRSITELLVAWLSELVWLAETEHLAVADVVVEELTPTDVHGRVSGVDADLVSLHGPPVKAVTYHGLDISHDDGWSATVILDV